MRHHQPFLSNVPLLPSSLILRPSPNPRSPPRRITLARASMDGNSELPLVLLVRPLFPAFENSLRQHFRFLQPWESPLPTHEFLSANASSIRALLCSGPAPVDDATLACLPGLQCVVATSAGVDHIDMDECRRRGIQVTNAGDVFSDDAADYAVGFLIDVLRRISASDRFVRSGLWPIRGDYPLGFKLGGKRVGIIGLGSIGSRVAKRLEAFGCTILYHSRTTRPSLAYKYFSNVCDLAAESDVLIVTCALTRETHHLINKDVLLALGKDGVVVNIGRGALIDEKELVKCLREGVIGGAGLDVFENEPNVPKELFAMDNVVLSHHRAIFTPESFSGLLQLVIDNLKAFFDGRPLLSPVSA
ncbi:glyoxylate/hydroxypyruvate reductase HPR3-like [Dioscorea cayenensis subsp. rotundata]|uniref:Glyoxylate/hydroxypyruvate reductase HPR3-like n=1 Tax=Dioscorea cayennensis subsp. rotundata TaxID=55577 RepID=A0AB40CW10_DIOCR|nr:glyoxylate/hydroxypyruvate reductase HPR3-like [Dioscorea cayenensis subsp. rotundata]